MDLQHYLGEEWIDYKVVNYYVNDKNPKEGSRSTANSRVFRCTSCNSPYESRSINSSGHAKGNRYLPDSVFKNVPLDRGDCGFCG